jgi:collagen type III alpha
MASSTGNQWDGPQTSTPDDGPDGSHAHGADGFVDFDEYIDIQLRTASSTIKSTDVMTALVGAGTLLTAYLLAFIILDQWLIPGGFSSTWRLLLLSLMLVGVVGWVGWKVIWPWRRRVNGLYSASTIERASPGFKGSLVNLVDLLRADREIPPEIHRSLERRAAVALRHVDVRETIDRRALLRLSMALFAVVVLFCGYWIFSPKNPASSLWRAIAPASDTSVATRTKIDSVRPGDVDVVARSQVDVIADVRGQLPPQAALYYTTADHKFVDERIDARPTAEGSREFHFVINGDNGAGILQDMTYRIAAGDDSTRDYKIHVIQPPAAAIDSIHLDYPDYTRLGSTVQTTGAIDAIEGTRVTLRATANMPLRSASLQFFDDDAASKRAEEIPVHIENGNKLLAQWPLQFRSDGTYAHFYRIFCTSVGGEIERAPTMYAVEIHPDRPPEIVLIDPKTDLDLPANAELPLLIEARDPDFLLTYINLKIQKDGAAVLPEPVYDGFEHPEQHVKKTYKWSLKQFQLRPKETITYWLEAQDNRKPIPNTTSTPRLKIHIIDPVPESQVKKDFLMAEKKQEQEAKHTDDSNGLKSDQDRVDDSSKPRAQDREKRQKEQKANQAKDEKQNEDLKDVKQQNEDQNQDQKNKSGQQGNEGEGDSKGAGGEKGQKGGQGNAEGGQQGQSQKPNPDDPSSDPKSLQTMHDHFQKEDEQKNKGGNGSDSKPQDGNNDSKSGDKDKKSGADKGDQKGSESGSESKAGNQSQDKRDNQSGQGAKPEAGSQSNRQDEKNQQQGTNRDSKDQNGAKPEGAKSDADKERQPREGNAGQKGDNKAAGGGDQNKPDAKANSQDGKNPEQPGATQQQPGEKQSANNQSKGMQQGAEQRDKKADQQGRQNQPGDKQSDEKSGDKQNGENQPGQKPQAGQKEPPRKEAGQKPDEGQGSGQDQGQQSKPDDKSQKAAKEARGGDEKGQPSPGDQSSPDDKKQSRGRSSDSASQRDQNQTKPDASQNPSNGAKPGDQKDQSTQSGVKQDASDSKGGQDQAKDKQANSADPTQGAKPTGEQNRKDPTKGTDATGRNGERSPQQQQETGAKPHPGQPQDSPQNMKPHQPAPDEKADSKAPKRRPNTQDPEEQPKGIDQSTDKLHSKSMRDEQQSNSKGDEQSDVGKTGDTKRSFDKNSPLSQEGTDKEGAKEKTRREGPPSKKGQEQSSTDQSARPQASKEGGQPQPNQPPQPGEQSQDGKPQHGQPGQSSKPSESKPSESKPDREGQQSQKGQQGQSSKQGNDSHPQKGSDESGQSSQSPQAGDQPGGNKPSQGGQSPAAGMGKGKGNNNGGGGFNNGNGSGPGEGLATTEKDANLNYAREATNLVLNRLQGQLSRGQVDEKLLKELGWTKDEVRRFVERMRRQVQSEQGNSPADEARRLQYEETLRSLDLKHSAKSRSGKELKKATVIEFENRRSVPPPEYKELYENYNKSLSTSQPPPDTK